MQKGEVRRVLLIILVLFMTACSQNQPKVTKIEKIDSKVKEQNQTINLTVLSKKLMISEEPNWVPLKVEDEIEWNAKELLGRKYVWGATGPINYDCSGFTRKIFEDVGVHLPRVSREQAKFGKKIHFSELKKGDLVFFQTNRRRPGLVTHVGIYLGDGDFIHASSCAKKIVICNFKKDKFYKKKFLWARRVLSQKEHVATSQNTNSKHDL